MKNHIPIIALLIASNMIISTIKCFATESRNNTKNEVYVVNHGWHTGFVVPTSYIQDSIPELKQRFGNTPYIEFWMGGQRNFIRRTK
jgi:hypothetical protein